MKSSSRLLIKESPLVVLPSLAVVVGLNEAIFLQQLNYWLDSSQHVHEDRRWVYNSFDSWKKQFPFWGVHTIRRTVESLRAQGVLITGNFNKSAVERTLWYTIDYMALDSLILPDVENALPSDTLASPSVQSGHLQDDNMDTCNVQYGHMLKEQETTTETTQKMIGKQPRKPTVVGKLMELGATRGQAVNALKVKPELSLDDVQYLTEWMQTQNPKYAVGTLVGCLQEGVTPPMPGTNGKPKLDMNNLSSIQIQALMNGGEF